MKYIFSIAFILLICFESRSETLWASKVNSFSSQFSKKEYSAKQALGYPSVIAELGPTKNAWTPLQGSKTEEYLDLSFTKAIKVRQIIINESWNPGALSRIELVDEIGNANEVYINPRAYPNNAPGRTLNIFIEPTPYKAGRIRVFFSNGPSRVDYQIDAVGISDEIEPVLPEINLPKKSILTTKLENLGRNVNSEYHELSPVITADGRTIYFTRDLHPYNIGSGKNQDVWLSKMDTNDIFGPAMNMSYPINNDYENFVISVSGDGNTLLLGNVYQKDGRMTKGLSSSRFTGQQWKFPEPVIIQNFYNTNQIGSFSLSADGKQLLMAVTREDGLGGLDLYVSSRISDSLWGTPLNLGPVINTAEDEGSPFIAADGKTLYFSTSGRTGYGDRDLYISRRLDDSWVSWSEPENLGPSINSEGWDAYFTIPASGKYAYMVSSKESFGKEDIYRLELPEALRPKVVILVKGKTLNYNTKQPLEANIFYVSLTTGKEVGRANSNPITGEFSITLPGGDKYGFHAETEGYLSIDENIDLTNLTAYKEIERNLYLASIERGQKITLNNIFFETGKFELLPESYLELDRLVQNIEENPLIKIEIHGHTDNVGETAKNKILSTQRAQAVANYLISKGVDPKRLLVVGYGETSPVSTNDTEEGRAQNRRVDFLIK